MKEIYELKGAGCSIREIARELDVSRNTVRRYLKSPEAMRPKPHRRRAFEVGFVHGLHRPQNGRGVGKLRGAAPGVGGAGI